MYDVQNLREVLVNYQEVQHLPDARWLHPWLIIMISAILKFGENILESLQNFSETAPWP